MNNSDDINFTRVAADIKALSKSYGFQDLRVSSVDLGDAPTHLENWLKKGFHGQMDYMTQNLDKRAHPAKLLPNTLRILSVRCDYLYQAHTKADIPKKSGQAYVARYALGRDYHKLIRKKLTQLAKAIAEKYGAFGYRAFTDSAPILERAIAEQAGLGRIGKNTMLINAKAGSWFFLGELFTDLPLPIDPPTTHHCGSCTACLKICPTQAIVAPYQLDARRCIAYLTIEHKGSIPVEFRKPIGNRIFGCDDCQLICPWNKFAKVSQLKDFQPRHQLNQGDLIDLFKWDEATFLKNTEGSAIRRTGYISWLRNIAIGLGNAPTSTHIIQALQSRLNHTDAVVREHVKWALEQHEN